MPEGDLAFLYLVRQPEWRERGDFSLQNERVRETDNPNLLYSGIALYDPAILEGAKVEKFSIVPRLRKAIQSDQVGGRLHEGNWDDVGTLERLHALQNQFGA